MKNKCGKNAVRVTAIMLCGILFAGSVAPVYAAEENTPKDENVYVNLNQDGSVDGIYVVNAYRLDADTQIVDYGNYESVKNLTSDAQISQQRGTVTVDAQAGEFFYQGNLQSKKIPWEISISYTLDGKEISTEELAGKNGKLRISIHVGQNDQVDSEFFENYLLQVTLTMDMERCSNLEAPGATAANVGTDKQLVYSILAGSEKDITVTADVLDFEMDAISFQGLPMNLDVDKEVFSLDDLYDKAGEISDAADEFSDGAQDLEGGVNSLQEGVEGLQSGAESLKEGIDSYADGAKSLGDGIDTLQDGSNDLADGAQELVDGITSLQDGANQLRDGYSGENGAASGARKLADGVKQLKTGSHQLSEGVSTLVDMISGLGGSSEGSLDERVQEVLDGANKLNPYLSILGFPSIDTGSETDSNLSRVEKVSESVKEIIKSMISASGSGTAMTAENETEESITPDADLEEESQDSIEGETAAEEEGEKGTDEPADTENGNSEGDEGRENEEDSEGDSGEESSSGENNSTEETGSSGDGESTEESTEESSSSSEENGPSSENSSSEDSAPNEDTESERVSEVPMGENPSAIMTTSARVDTAQIRKEASDGTMTAVYKLSNMRQMEPGRMIQTTVSGDKQEKTSVLSLSTEQGGDRQIPVDSDFIVEKLFELKAGADKLIGAYGAIDQLSATLGSEETVAQLQQLKEGAAALDSGIGDLESATDALADGISQLADGTSQLADGVSELADGGSEFADGTKELADGVSDLADGVDVLNDASEALQDGSAQLADGTGELLDGTGDLADGVSDLKDGTDEFKDQAGDIDTQIDEEVDGVISDLSGSDFEQISFVSDKNTNVELVQFVMQTEGIQVPEETDIPVEEEPMSFWQRLLALFGF